MAARRRTAGALLAASALVLSYAGPAGASSWALEVRVVGPATVTPLRVGPPAEPLPRDLDPYRGLGTWVDVFDTVEAYAGSPPPIGPEAVDHMADRGVRTLYLQAARWDDRAPAGIVDRALLRSFLLRAHARGLRVVAWYLPELGDLDRDLDRIRQLLDFEVSGHRFDGIGIDIEWTDGVPDHAARNVALIDLSARAHALAGEVPLAAIVLPAVQIEVINTSYWPDFPYRELAPFYGVWMPMAYWSFRGPPYDDGARYVEESVERLRSNLGDPGAIVHPIGGIADAIDDEHIEQFAEALARVGAVGGSLYDWNTTPPGRQALLERAFTTGPAADLPAPG